MKLKDLKYLAQEQIIELKFDDENISNLDCDEDISIHHIAGELFLKQKDLLLKITNSKVLARFTSLEHFLWLAIATKNQTLLIQTIPCMPNRFEFEALDVAIDDEIIEQVSKRNKQKKLDINQVTQWLKNEFILRIQETNNVLFIGDNNYKHSNIQTIVGKNNLLLIEFTKDDKVRVKSLKKLPNNKNFNLSLLQAEISFVDYTVAGRIQDPLLKEKLDELNRDNSAYINLWNRYNLKVKEKAIEFAREVGFVRYVKFEVEDSVDGYSKWKFYFQEKDAEKVKTLCDSLKGDKGRTLELNKVLPSWLENNIDEILLDKDDKTKSISAKLINGSGGYPKQFIELKLTSNGKPEERGVIYLSIVGDIVQMQRREKARESITSFTNPIKNLRFLIEDSDIDLLKRKDKKTLAPLSPSAKKSFKGDPTPKQIEALDVALNTPDIALILGPPGTGKTQVISALQNRLADEYKSKITGQILLTSYQNDAVDNVVARSEAFGIPAIRADDNKSSPRLLEQWVKRQSSELGQVVSDLSETEGSYKIVKNIYMDIAAILDGNVNKKQKFERVKSLLEDVDNLRIHHGFKIPSEITIEIEDRFLTKKDSLQKNDRSKILKHVRGLRVTPVSYLDDGFEQTFTCLSALKRLDNFSSEAKELEIISDQIELTEEHFETLRIVKNKLLDEFIPDYRPSSLQNGLTNEERLIINQLGDLIKTQTQNCLAGIPEVIEEYLELIKFQPDYLKQSIAHYTTSIGASCQRSDSNKVIEYKDQLNVSLNELSIGHTFDTVIVDEAARANPLDLFIPMALASERIILVGDHFQLPQMLEPDIEKEMIDSGELESETANAIKDSLFERLYKQLQKREAKDGVQRTVMLDTQFRMHPKIGDFISRNFYESQGEPKILSGLGEDEFNLDIPKYRNKVAEWIDLPLSIGKEKRSGTSWKRECEASKVVEEVQYLLEANANLSIGVITFFAPQRELILKKLSQVDLCKKTNDGWEYLSGLNTTDKGDEKLRVGSVDAFQGKEFDVIILSMVRSNDYKCSEENSYRKKYGFIRTPNRLNVAFSRAKSLILTVGDKNMFASDSAKEAIPQVWHFVHDLCEGIK